MPELSIRFDRDRHAVMGEDFVGVISLTVPPFQAVLQEAGLPAFDDLIGLTPEEKDLINAEAPSDCREGRTPAPCPWPRPDRGFEMSTALRAAMAAQPARFADWRGMIDHMKALLDAIEAVLAREKERGALFRAGQSS